MKKELLEKILTAENLKANHSSRESKVYVDRPYFTATNIDCSNIRGYLLILGFQETIKLEFRKDRIFIVCEDSVFKDFLVKVRKAIIKIDARAAVTQAWQDAEGDYQTTNSYKRAARSDGESRSPVSKKPKSHKPAAATAAASDDKYQVVSHQPLPALNLASLMTVAQAQQAAAASAAIVNPAPASAAVPNIYYQQPQQLEQQPQQILAYQQFQQQEFQRQLIHQQLLQQLQRQQQLMNEQAQQQLMQRHHEAMLQQLLSMSPQLLIQLIGQLPPEFGRMLVMELVNKALNVQAQLAVPAVVLPPAPVVVADPVMPTQAVVPAAAAAVIPPPPRMSTAVASSMAGASLLSAPAVSAASQAHASLPEKKVTTVKKFTPRILINTAAAAATTIPRATYG